jgi:AAA family ATP:ADP antiporter
VAAVTTAERRASLVRVVALCVLAFLVMVSYAVARPATESLFLETQSVDDLPLVWLLEAVAVVVTVIGFARLMARYELLRLFGATSVATAAALALLLVARRAGVPYVDFALYLWKDIYVVLLVETFYCYTNAVYPIAQARWFYGLFGVVSSVGSLVGGVAVGPLAEGLGTAASLWTVVPICLVMWVICVPFSRVAGVSRPADEAGPPPLGLAGMVRVVRGSPYVALLVVLVAVLQVVVNLVDYEFNRVLREAFPDTDTRTAVIGQVYAALSVATVLLHALTGPVLRLAGVPAVLLAVPILLGAGLVAFMVSPTFATGAALKVASKCFDYTVFRAAKEILYIPLGYDEKTQGKTVVDVLGYRVAKGGASLLLIGLGQVPVVAPALATVALVSPLALVLTAVWVYVTVVVARRFRAKVSRVEEMGSGA